MRTLLTAALTLVVAAPGALACTCVPASDSTYLANAEVAFTGTVRLVAPPPLPGSPVAVTFAVDSVGKGKTKRAVVVSTASDGATCGVTFDVARRYLVYAQQAEAGAPLTTALCDGTRAVRPDAAPAWVRTVPATFVKSGRFVSSMQVRNLARRPLASALARLLDGPSEAETKRGLKTSIPTGVLLRRLRITSDQRVLINVSRKMRGLPYESERLAVGQLIRTATTNGASRVRVLFGGKPTSTFIGPMDARDVPISGNPPPIILKSAAFVSETGAVSVGGTANVFEATVNLRLRRGTTVVAESVVTAACGTGCRGSFAASLAVPVGTAGPLEIEAYTLSADDGSEVGNVSLPVAGI